MDSATKKTFWDHAGIAGLLSGMISSANMFLGQYLGTMHLSAIMTTIIGSIMWLAETVGCIGLMYFYMKKFSLVFPQEGIKVVYRMGVAIAFFSALIYSTVTFANLAYISADFYTEQYTLLMQQLASVMDSNSKAAMTKVLANMPQIAFFGNLIYCFIFGTVAASIISRTMTPKNSSSENITDEQ